MNRKSLFGRFASPTSANQTAELLDYQRVHIEPLEERNMLAVNVAIVDDHWINLSGGNMAIGMAVQKIDGTLAGTLGSGSSPRFGLVYNDTGILGDPSDDTLVFDGTANTGRVAGGQYISDAINPVIINPGGTISILEGTYHESDIVVDVNVLITGRGTTGVNDTLIVPATNSNTVLTGNDVADAFASGTHSAFIVYTPSSSFQNLHINGSGGTLGALKYHHGITVLYGADGDPDYSAVSKEGDTPVLYEVVQINATATATPTPLTHLALLVGSNGTGLGAGVSTLGANLIENIAYHGISISARKDENFTNLTANNVTTSGVRINRNTVQNIGSGGSQLQATGIFFQNQDDLRAMINNVTNAGTGIHIGIWSTPGSERFANNTIGAMTRFALDFVQGSSPFNQNTVTDARVRGYDFHFLDGSAVFPAAFNFYNTTGGNLATNTTVGLYINHTAVSYRAWRIQGARIGVEIQNTSRLNFEGDAATEFPDFNSDFTITGPGIGVGNGTGASGQGGIGVYAHNGASFDGGNTATNLPAHFNFGMGNSISGYTTAIRAEAPGAAENNTSTFLVARLRESGNGTGLVVGDNITVKGEWSSADPIVSTGSSTLKLGFDQNGRVQVNSLVLANGTYRNSVSPTVIPPFPPTTLTPDAPAPSATTAAQPTPGILNVPNLTLSSTSTAAFQVSGLPATTLLDDFSTAFTFFSSSQVGISPWLTNGFLPAGARSTQWNAGSNTTIIQNGTSGALKIKANNATPGPNGATEVLNGYAWHYYQNPTNGQLTTWDASSFDTFEVVLRLPNTGVGGPENGFGGPAAQDAFRIGLIDADNTSRAWVIPTAILNSTTFTTVRLNLHEPNFVVNGTTPPNSASFGSSDGLFNLEKIAGWMIMSDQLSATTRNFGIVVDNMRMMRETGVSQIRASVTGGVTLAGATIQVSVNNDFIPTPGQTFKIIDMPGAVTPVSGQFKDQAGNLLAQGANFAAQGGRFSISYIGGDGNDVVLTSVAEVAPTAFDLHNGQAGNNSTVSYTGLFTHTPVNITSGAIFTDPDDAYLYQLDINLQLTVGTDPNGNPVVMENDHLISTLPKTISLDRPGTEEDEYAITGTNIRTYYDEDEGNLRLSGVDTIANYMLVLNSIQYSNHGEPGDTEDLGPGSQTRTAEITAYSSGSITTRNLVIDVDSLNSAPVVDLNGPGGGGVNNTTSITIPQVYNGTEVKIAPSGTIVDDDAVLFSLLINMDTDLDPGLGLILVQGDLLKLDDTAFPVTLYDDHEDDEDDEEDILNEDPDDDEYLIDPSKTGGTSMLTNYNSANGELTIYTVAGQAPRDTFQQILQQVVYKYQYGLRSQIDLLDRKNVWGPAATQRTTAVTAQDGKSVPPGSTWTLQTDIGNVTPALDLSSTAGKGGVDHIQFDDIPVSDGKVIFPDIGLTDADDAGLLGVTFTTAGGASNTEKVVADLTGFPNMGFEWKINTVGGAAVSGIGTLYSKDPGVNGLQTVNAFRTVLSTLIWSDPAGPSTTGNRRDFTVAVYDGSSRPTAIENLQFDPGYDPLPAGGTLVHNPPPFVDLNGSFVAGNNSTTTYTGVATVLAPTLFATVPPFINNVAGFGTVDPDIWQLRVSFNAGNFTAGDVLSVPAAALTGTFITQSYNAGTGVLTLTGYERSTTYTTALQQLTYSSSGVLTNGTTKTLTFLVDDTVSNNNGTWGTTLYSPSVARVFINVSANSSIVNRQLFYNNSAWDGNTLGVSTSDVLALATDKVAYLPGGGAMVNPGNAASPNSFKHVTSYSRGINGIFIDIQGPHAASLTAADFEFRINTGTNNSPSTWALAPNPSTITILPNTPAIGTDRIEIIWPNNSIRNNWLAVYVKANANTGLANNPGGKYGAGNGDLFFFGNRIGDAWVADAGSFSTGANDEVATHGSGGAGVAITNRFDFDRNKAVGVNDESIAHLSGGILSYINIGIPPLAPPPAPPADGGGDESGDAGISSALASSSAGGGSSASLPQWVADRLATADLNSGPMASFFQHLADKNTPESREILLAADNLADSLGLDDSLLDDLIAGLGL